MVSKNNPKTDNLRKKLSFSRPYRLVIGPLVNAWGMTQKRVEFLRSIKFSGEPLTQREFDFALAKNRSKSDLEYKQRSWDFPALYRVGYFAKKPKPARVSRGKHLKK